jgi:hypothetical protein
MSSSFVIASFQKITEAITKLEDIIKTRTSFDNLELRKQNDE